ncbi:hypothetical protein D3C74_59760 [compost metagenome]
MPEGLEEDLLSAVLGLGIVVQHMIAVEKDRSLIFMHDPLELCGIATEDVAYDLAKIRIIQVPTPF